jgi:hypothetical protein
MRVLNMRPGECIYIMGHLDSVTVKALTTFQASILCKDIGLHN